MENVFEVRGNSLTGVLEPGDSIRLLPIPEKIKRDSLVVFLESPNHHAIKICKGVPGDQITINSETKEIRVNGTLMPITFLNDAQVFCWKDWIRFAPKVPQDCLFLLGTQPEAIDSRSRGYFSMQQVVGLAEKVILRTEGQMTLGQS